MSPETLFEAERLAGPGWTHGPLDAFLVRWLVEHFPDDGAARLWVVAAGDFGGLATDSRDSVLVLGVGGVGDDPLVPRLLADGRRLVLLRELGPFLAASRVALLYPRDCHEMPGRLERLAGLFRGNLDFLTMARRLVELARENAELDAVREELRTARAELAALRSSRVLRLVRAVRAVLTWPLRLGQRSA